jgi:hypothetical protein
MTHCRDHDNLEDKGSDEMIRANVLGAFMYLPLMAAMLSQGSSCNNSKMRNDSNDTRNQAHNSSVSQKESDSLVGLWGGDHISLQIDGSGATLDYDCAHGTITQKIVPDQSGKFEVRGFHMKEHPGPTRQGEAADGEPATYKGSLNDKTMNLTVTLNKSGETVGPFTLTYGKMGRIRKCG